MTARAPKSKRKTTENAGIERAARKIRIMGDFRGGR